MQHIRAWGSALLVCALVTPAWGQAVAPVKTGFDPARHGQPFVNFGDFANSMGNCLAMSLLSIHAFRTGQGSVAPQIVHPPQSADVTRQMVASLVQAQYELHGLNDEGPRKPITDPQPVRSALERMRAGGPPEVIAMVKPDFGHGNVLFGYDGKDLLLYDPNFPGQTIRWPWDPQKGLGTHPKYPGLKFVSVTPFSQWKVSKQLDALRQACVNRDNVCVGRFPNIDARMERTAAGKLVVAGRVGAPLLGERRQKGESLPGFIDGMVWLTIDGRPLTHGTIKKPRSANGAMGIFVVALPQGVSLTGQSVRAVLTTTQGTFGGYVDVPVLRDGQTGGQPAGASRTGSATLESRSR